MTSAICAPRGDTGFNAFIALWQTSDIRRQRKPLSSASLTESTASPANLTSPCVITAGGGNRRNSASAAVDLPQPDSPASPNTSPGAISNDTLSTARTAPLGVRYSTLKFFTLSSGSAIRPPDHRCGEARLYPLQRQALVPALFGAQARIGD